MTGACVPAPFSVLLGIGGSFSRATTGCYAPAIVGRQGAAPLYSKFNSARDTAHLDGATFYLAEHIPACQAAIAALHPGDERTLKLVDTVKLALAAAAAGSDETPEIAERMLWAHREYVQGYFRHAVNDFDHSPYFQV